MCNCKKYQLSEVKFDAPLLDLGQWIKLPELPVSAQVDKPTKELVLIALGVLVIGVIAVVRK